MGWCHPVTTHYYDPLVLPGMLRHPLGQPRSLPGIDWRDAEQAALLGELTATAELASCPLEPDTQRGFHFRNDTFGAGDVEIYYAMIRKWKPRRIIEIGAGYSSFVATKAIEQNRREDSGYNCRHVCVEPFENPWLAELPAEIVRRAVEDVGVGLVADMEPGDILFIDSTHVIRAQGDVVFEYLELIPRVPAGVLIHAHDIFSPRDDPTRWLFDSPLLWHEQYLLEALLSENPRLKVLLALNRLYHQSGDALMACCPVLRAEGGPEPGSIWLQRQ